MSREGRSAKRRREGRRVFFLLLPIMFFAIAFVYLPFIRTIINAFSRVNSKGIIKSFAGLENFIYTYSRKDFLPALKHTLMLKKTGKSDVGSVLLLCKNVFVLEMSGVVAQIMKYLLTDSKIRLF